MRFAGFVMTFNRPEILGRTLERALGQSRPPEYILVVDNGEGAQAADVASRFPEQRVGYHSMGFNSGPAGAASHALATLSGLGYDWIWWGDDDDPPQTHDTFERLLHLAESQPSGETGAVVAYGSRWDWNTGESIWLPESQLHGTIDVDTFGGCAGPLISAAAVRHVGVPNRELFFGREEWEYALRIRRAGLRIIADGELAREYREILGWTNRAERTTRNKLGRRRSPWRQYYSTRNYIHFMRAEFGRHDLARREAVRSLLRAAASWRGGIRYGAEFSRRQLAAVIDGYTGRLGRTVVPVAKYASPAPPVA